MATVPIPSVFDSTFSTYKRVTTSKLTGEGGCGYVFEVETPSGDRYALKLLKPDAVSTEKLRRFKNEIAYCSQARHEHIIRVLDHGFVTCQGVKCPFYIMSLFPSTLRTYIGAGDHDLCLRLFFNVLDGIEASHFASVWHRDLKPENILVSKTNMAVVADFGIAHFNESLLQTAIETSPHSRLANFQYAAPEQRERGGRIDGRADIYSLGLILNELLTGKVPHGLGFREIGESAPQLSFLDAIVAQMIRQDPSERPQSIGDVKKMINAESLIAAGLQRVSAIDGTVIKATEVDDPLIATPVKPTKVDYENGYLIVSLNAPPGSDWFRFFRSIRYHTCLWGCEPSTYDLRGNVLRVAVSGDHAPRVLEDTKRFIDLTNKDYATQKREAHVNAQRVAEQQAADLRRKEEDRVRVLRSLRL